VRGILSVEPESPPRSPPTDELRKAYAFYRANYRGDVPTDAAERIIAEFQVREDTMPATDLFVWLRQAILALAAHPAPAGYALMPKVEMTDDMMNAGQLYLDSKTVALNARFTLPATFNWHEFWQALLSAAPLAHPAPAADAEVEAVCQELEVTGAYWSMSTCKRAASLLRRLAAERAAAVPEGYVLAQHIGWLRRYVFGMNADNWCDMRLRAELQLDELSAAIRARSAADRPPPRQVRAMTDYPVWPCFASEYQRSRPESIGVAENREQARALYKSAGLHVQGFLFRKGSDDTAPSGWFLGSLNCARSAAPARGPQEE
jgi:hypothetical protein